MDEIDEFIKKLADFEVNSTAINMYNNKNDGNEIKMTSSAE